MTLFDHLKMGLMLLVIFGIPILFLIYIHKLNKSYYKRVIGDLSDEVKEQLIHAGRQKVANREKKILWHQMDSGRHFRGLSVLFFVMVVIAGVQVWIASGVNIIIGCLITYAMFEMAAFFVIYKNERHLLPWCRNYRTKGYVLNASLVRGGGVHYTIAYYNCKKGKIVFQDISINFTNRKDKLKLEGNITDVVIRKRGIYEKVVAIPLEENSADNRKLNKNEKEHLKNKIILYVILIIPAVIASYITFSLDINAKVVSYLVAIVEVFLYYFVKWLQGKNR